MKGPCLSKFFEVIEMLFRLLKDKRGNDQIIVFLVLLPLMLVIFLGLAQLVVYGYCKLATQQAAYIGARAGAKNPEIETVVHVKDAVNKFCYRFLSDWEQKGTVTVEFSDPFAKPGSTIRVTVTYNFPKYPFWSIVLKLDKDDVITSVAQDVIEEVP